ncbi:MAG: hypothetical protein IJX26_03435 [Clostridia bacterium]|nr:hypothetical protein [Clostridia bacterium]
MGHTTTKTTQKFYIKVLSDFEKQEANKVNNAICATFADTFLIKTKKSLKLNQYLVLFKNKIYKI